MKNSHGEIKPVIGNIKRPLWSVIIPTYNCANYLKETIESILAQYPGQEKMEIIVVDDYSTKDDPETVVNNIGTGRVKYIQQKQNVGKARNYETGLNEAKGKYIHLLHGDDTVIKGFYLKIDELFRNFPEAGAAFCQCNYINAEGEIKQKTGQEISFNGIIPNWAEKIATWQRIQPPSIVFKREVYEKLGGYNYQLTNFEDWEFYVRAGQYFHFAFTPEILANYRVYSNNSSIKSIAKGKRLKILDRTLKIIDKNLDREIRKKISIKRKEAKFNYVLGFFSVLKNSRDVLGYLRTVYYLLRMQPNFNQLKKLIYFSLFFSHSKTKSLK